MAEWFSGPCNPHQKVFVKSIDLVVHLLGPDLDVIITELTSLGRRHHRYMIDMQQHLQKESFQCLVDAFLQTLTYFLEQETEKTVASEIDEESILHASKRETILTSWKDTFTMIRIIMKQGVKIELKRHKRRLDKQRRCSSEQSASTSETASVTSSLLESPTAGDLLQTPSPKSSSSSAPRNGRGLARMASVRMQAKNFLRSPPLRTRSEQVKKVNSSHALHRMVLGRQ